MPARKLDVRPDLPTDDEAEAILATRLGTRASIARLLSQADEAEARGRNRQAVWLRDTAAAFQDTLDAPRLWREE